MFRKILTLVLVLVFSFAAASPAFAGTGAPNFSGGLYGDGQLWGTKGTANLPAPNDHNYQSFDKIFIFAGATGPDQYPVAEAAPGNPMYNGGRWYTHSVRWNADGMMAHPSLPTLKSYAEIMIHYNLGHLDITEGTFEGDPPTFFDCPMLPVK